MKALFFLFKWPSLFLFFWLTRDNDSAAFSTMTLITMARLTSLVLVIVSVTVMVLVLVIVALPRRRLGRSSLPVRSPRPPPCFLDFLTSLKGSPSWGRGR